MKIVSDIIVTARKRSLRRLCFYTCLSVILFTGTGCMVAGGMRGCWGACMVAMGHAWLQGDVHGCGGRGACMVVGGMHGCWGGAWLLGGMHGCWGVHGYWGGGCVVVRGTCVVAGGVCGCWGMHGCGGGHVWLRGVCMVGRHVWLQGA